MRDRQSGWRRVVTINLCFFGAACSASSARFIWPDTMAWWQLGVFSIVLGVASVLLVIEGLKGIWTLILHDLEKGWFFRRGREARSDRLAGDERLRKEDMIR